MNELKFSNSATRNGILHYSCFANADPIYDNVRDYFVYEETGIFLEFSFDWMLFNESN